MSLMLESTMWRLSTLGGALSSMGEFFELFVSPFEGIAANKPCPETTLDLPDSFDSFKADQALETSLKQRQIAAALGDRILVSRCNLYIALALSQKGHFSNAIHIVR